MSGSGSSGSSSSSASAPPVSDLMPQHSTDLAEQLSAHLSSALSDDRSYKQINDAKLRGMSALVGWEQFHGMVLTAHLQPVNLRAEPIDELGQGVARTKKMEQSKSRAANTQVIEHLMADHKQEDEQEKRINEQLMKQWNLTAPTNAHEFARDWKRIGTNSADQPELLQTQRYRYLQSLDLRSSSLLLKGGIPLDMIGSIIDVLHAQWVQLNQAETAKTGDKEGQQNDESQSDAPADAPAAASSDAPAASASASAAPSLPPPSELYHCFHLLHSLSGMSSFAISIFSLSAAHRARMAQLLDVAERAMQAPEWSEWSEKRKAQSEAAQQATPPIAAASPAAAPAASKPAASSYPMMLPGWSNGGSAGPAAQLASSTPARDEANDGAASILSAPVPSKPSATLSFELTPQLLAQIRAKYKVH